MCARARARAARDQNHAPRGRRCALNRVIGDIRIVASALQRAYDSTCHGGHIRIVAWGTWWRLRLDLSFWISESWHRFCNMTCTCTLCVLVFPCYSPRIGGAAGASGSIPVAPSSPRAVVVLVQACSCWELGVSLRQDRDTAGHRGRIIWPHMWENTHRHGSFVRSIGNPSRVRGCGSLESAEES